MIRLGMSPEEAEKMYQEDLIAWHGISEWQRYKQELEQKKKDPLGSLMDKLARQERERNAENRFHNK